MSSTDDIRPGTRMADAIRRDIVYGHLPPGARIPQYEYAARYHTGPYTAHKAVKILEREQLIYCPSYTDYAAPAGPPDPAVTARLGTTLARLRETSCRDPEDLATGKWDARHVTAAENGTWQPRDFWPAMDTALGADGTLLKIHDNYYAGPAPAATDPGDTAGTPADLLTSDEREAVRQAGLIYQLISKRIIAHGPSRDEDISELTTAIHIIQRMVTGQAAARAYPGQYRLLGQVIPITEELQ